MAAPEMISKEVVHSNVPGENKIIDLQYEKTRLEELEEIMEDWINFNFTEHESEEESWYA